MSCSVPRDDVRQGLSGAGGAGLRVVEDGRADDPSTWSVRKLKNVLTEAGIDHAYCVEKRELLALAVGSPCPLPDAHS
jgi:hypothetical protein